MRQLLQMLRAGDAACSQVNELMTELDELRAELLRTCSCLTQTNAERNASAARVEQLEGSLEELSQQVLLLSLLVLLVSKSTNTDT